MSFLTRENDAMPPPPPPPEAFNILKTGGAAERAAASGGFSKVSDPMDYSDRYNTKLSDEEEARYQKWAKENKRDKDTYDYDMRGAWKEGIQADENAHFPDTFKKPNHPSFSDESRYHGRDGHKGGRWSTEGGRDKFRPGPTNIELHGPKGLADYFGDKRRVGDMTDLVLPEGE